MVFLKLDSHIKTGKITFSKLLGYVLLSGGSERKESAYNVRDLGSIPGLGISPRKWQSTPVFLPGESHEQKSLAGYSPCGRKELDTTEQLTL